MPTVEILNVATQNAALDAIKGEPDGGTLQFFKADTSLLASLALSATAFKAASGGVLVANAITPTNASATGTIAYSVIYTSAPAAWMELSVSLAGDGGCVILDKLTATNGKLVTISVLAVALPTGP